MHSCGPSAASFSNSNMMAMAIICCYLHQCQLVRLGFIHDYSSVCATVSLLLNEQFTFLAQSMEGCVLQTCYVVVVVVVEQPWQSISLKEGFMLRIRVKDSGCCLPFLGLPKQKGAWGHLETVVTVEVQQVKATLLVAKYAGTYKQR